MSGVDRDQEGQGCSDHRSTAGDLVRIGDYEVPIGVQIDISDQRVIERIEACLTHPLAATFTRAMDALGGMTKGQPGSHVRLWLDFAPLSFEWVLVGPDGRARLNGGLIFHGSHDGLGNGGVPTFSVSLSNEAGWMLHT